MVGCGIPTLLENSLSDISPIKLFKLCANATAYLLVMKLFYTKWNKSIDIIPIGMV